MTLVQNKNVYALQQVRAKISAFAWPVNLVLLTEGKEREIEHKGGGNLRAL